MTSIHLSALPFPLTPHTDPSVATVKGESFSNKPPLCNARPQPAPGSSLGQGFFLWAEASPVVPVDLAASQNHIFTEPSCHASPCSQAGGERPQHMIKTHDIKLSKPRSCHIQPVVQLTFQHVSVWRRSLNAECVISGIWVLPLICLRYRVDWVV